MKWSAHAAAQFFLIPNNRERWSAANENQFTEQRRFEIAIQRELVADTME